MMTFILGGLITWRLSLMVVKEIGPLGIFERFRAYAAKNHHRRGDLFDALSCFGCVSVYMGAVTALGAAHGLLEWMTYTLAFSAIALLIARILDSIKS